MKGIMALIEEKECVSKADESIKSEGFFSWMTQEEE